MAVGRSPPMDAIRIRWIFRVDPSPPTIRNFRPTWPHRRRAARQLRAYARGCGRLLVTGQFGTNQGLMAIAGGPSFGLRNGHPYQAIDGMWVFIGGVEGITGRLISRHASIRPVEK